MNSNRNIIFAFAALAGAAVALWAGMPALYLLVVACPVMMLFMMASMSGGMGHSAQDTSTRDGTGEANTGPRTP